MNLLQAALRTFDAFADQAGIIKVDEAPLTPISHAILKAEIELTLSDTGTFSNARPIAKKEMPTIIPVTIDSAARTSNPIPHPLCDKLEFLNPANTAKFTAYLNQLRDWAHSDFSHPKVRAVLAYIEKGSLINDLLGAGIIARNDKGILAKDEGKIVRWRVLDPNKDTDEACWKDTGLFEAYRKYYEHLCADRERALCMLSGKQDIVCDKHPKGTLAASYGAKLLSANDDTDFTYRGRFSDARQAYNVGYIASQKAHHALQWIVANHGASFGNRRFVCWNPDGKKLPNMGDFLGYASKEHLDFVSYRNQLISTLGGYRNQLSDMDDIVIVALDAATTGRLSVTYYSELKAPAFFDHIEHWYTTCCWNTRFKGTQSPPLRDIANCACGTERGKFIEGDARVVKEYLQRLLHCMLSGSPLPTDIVTSLVRKSGHLLPYSKNNRELLLTTTCALVRKFYNDKTMKEEWTLTLDVNNNDRSYLFGRLLAMLEHVECSTYTSEEGREPNAMRMRSVFVQRPMYAWKILEDKLMPYFNRMNKGLSNYYKTMIAELLCRLPDDAEATLDKELDPTYLLGYYLQRTALTTKKITTIEEEQQDGRTDNKN